MIQPFLALVLGLGGLVVALVGYLGRTERLPRNRFVGLRTPATMRSEEAFRVANRAAGPPTIIGGAVGVAGAVVAWFAPNDGTLLAAVLVTSIGMVPPMVVGVLRGIGAAKQES
ncbi:SdpI/YhfL family protein [Saccharothrix saharensis]|uniref:SdpI/YhfL family protein n=1 Tax=Saccharothrix saharensis TaxID=571190 RepID=A0A543JIT8_9PSEU|nr:SdpI family protein [Saccharothrix saharensis]TQM82782.1 SdpI/YhfL family protein [Saccharothrix saharensis]